jgi:hypothetical protein
MWALIFVLHSENKRRMIPKISKKLFVMLVTVVFYQTVIGDNLFRWVLFLTVKKKLQMRYYSTCRIPVHRVRDNSSTESNCTVSTTNVTTCNISSRTFGKIAVTKSSAFESLVNEADVSNYQSHFKIFYKKRRVMFSVITKVVFD